MVTTHHPFIERALAVVNEELEIAAAEQRAFKQFRSRLSAIDPDPSPSLSGVTTAGKATMAVSGYDAEPSGESLQKARTVYRETVMTVPHFESEYGDTLKENVAIEFGADLANQLMDGDRLTRVVREALLSAAASVIDERETYERNLVEERESLREIHAGVADYTKRAYTLGEEAQTTSGSETLAELDTRFAELEEECADLATARQHVIHSRRNTQISGVDEKSLTTLLYRDLETPCPGLTAITRCLDTIQNRRRQNLR
jgi:hypothetical protein